MREWTKLFCLLGGFVFFIGIGGAAVLNRHKIPAEPPRSSAPADVAAGAGDGTVVTLVPKYYRRVPIALLSPDDLDAAILAQGAIVMGTGERNEPANPQELQDLVLSGRLIVVDSMTKATRLLETGTQPHIGKVVRVQIVDGPYRGKVGWVSEEWLRPSTT